MKTIAFALPLLAIATPALAADLRPDQQQFRALYKELVETNTTVTNGSCTLAAERMAARLKAAGLPESQITLFAVPEHPKDGGLVAVLPGRDPKAKAVLMLAHIDVVEAKREDWTRDPFTLIEEGGYFYARGTSDDKAMAAVFTDTMARFAASKAKPRRTLKLALTCGEETSGAFNGADWLAKNRRQLIDAEFALNEGGGGLTDGKGLVDGGKLTVQELQVGEKAYVDYTLTATNPGGHSSQPVKDNAIVALAQALERVHAYEFPLRFSDTTRAYFAKAGALRHDDTGKAMIALAANPADKAAEAVVNQDKMLHSLLRTTCVPTLISGGHALNALPQRATANVNCRIFPDQTAEQTQTALVAAIANPAISVEPRIKDKPIATMPPLDPKVVGPIERLSAKYFPGVPVIPSMATGASDAVYISAVGIPTYGVPGIWGNPDGDGIHGLNERIEVRSLMVGRDYLYDLIHAYVD
ncbi:MAG: M20/M25/M40 family metallo-hydrolase [Sphingomonadales bacterium]|nr:M20/M25/M40 family metallo-hydrolase [Sphingomonadales bacterium]